MAKDTKVRILNAAETLFAEQGYAQTSMRTITARADVNLASVNYHFGSKKNLIQAVLKRYFDLLMPQVDEALLTVQPRLGAQGVEAVLAALVPPMMTLSQFRSNGTEIFVQLLGRGYNETQGHLRRFIMNGYGETVGNLVAAIRACLPQIPDQQIFWRLHFAIGSFVFSMASSKALKEIAAADYHQQVEIADVINNLVPFVAQGIAGSPVAPD
ncbi:TetR/AcrR family transcriptional regulator [Alteromonas aestuariivivens]|uniref:TetR/AcrR family transcriptional regulator n=1 Tax=Alteromonas aestuariivivens TaxID=1938339 RepID=A0A3D8M8V6_9ALTE|nr:TetR/AcrR family transcriptional regulator [Alteromonas aestuariivivens]RDV26036.1 TetR/AcrR family transcriptional regulator [Alteromonas aestuariivivens]